MDRSERSAPALLVFASIAMLVLSCSGATPGAVSSASPTGTIAGPIQTPSARPNAPSHVTTYGGATLVRGTESELVVSEGTVTGATDAAHSRDGTATVTVTSNDARVAGTMTGTWNSDRWGTSVADGALIQWGSGRLTNAGGYWEGSYTGFYTTQTTDRIVEWYTGHAAYEGLSFVRWLFHTSVGTRSGEWEGLIFPGSTPPTSRAASIPAVASPATASARPLPTPIVYGAATLVSGGTGPISIVPGNTTGTPPLTHARNGTISYVQTSNDARVAGTAAGTYNADCFGPSIESGAVVEWGATRLENEGGAWVDAWAGFYTPETTDRVIRWYTGTGGYQGLSFVMWLYRTDVRALTVDWTGLIFPGSPPPSTPDSVVAGGMR